MGILIIYDIVLLGDSHTLNDCFLLWNNVSVCRQLNNISQVDDELGSAGK